jgi:nucleoside-diphosphate-sugar epimerase
MTGGILITGASGFIGKNLIADSFFKSSTSIGRTRPESDISHVFANFGSTTDYEAHLNGIHTVVHLAGRAHIIGEDNLTERALMHEINTQGTLNFAEQCARSGIKKFIFISSAKVLGEKTEPGAPFSHHSKIDPSGSYALSKADAEVSLISICKKYSMNYTIIRPPLIYGPGVKGNVRALKSLIKWSIPLPFGRVDNRRSMVSMSNLIELIKVCINSGAANNETFLVSDNNDLSTVDLINLISKQSHTNSVVFDCPLVALKTIFVILGRKQQFLKLTQSFQVDISHTTETLNWHPRPIDKIAF